MKVLLRVMAVMALFAFAGATAAQAADPMGEKEASPKLKERIMGDAVKGTVLKVDGNTIAIRDDDGKEVKLHIDTSTKMDKVIAGDRVKAYHTDNGHVTTLQRLDEKK